MVHRWILTGAGLEIQPRFDPDEVLGLVLEGRVTHLSLVPAMLVGLVEALESEPSHRVRLEAASHLRCVLVGGAACPPVLVDRALALGLPLALTYGLTQASSQVATATPEEVKGGGAGCGRPLDGVEVRILDGGTAGEILVRGPTVALGYLGTDESMTDPDGWLHTGDRGRIDGDGRLHVLGRLDGLIISGGSNVQPEEVESFLRSLDGIRDAVVVGVPDERWGQRVCAALMTEHPDPDPAGVRESVLAACREGLAPAKRPRTIVVTDALPLTPNGKIDREAVRVLVSAFSNDSGRSDSDPGPNP
jgi:O-succinylbenzoic acid--CoA ligase